jgi:hypothetical protein
MIARPVIVAYASPTAPLKYSLEVSQDETPVRGNAMASGDADDDREVEDAILNRLDGGDVWAWAFVTVAARLPAGPKQPDWVGKASLGGCSYKDEEEFRRDDYCSQLEHEAFEDLLRNVRFAKKRGEAASALLAEIPGSEEEV